MILQNRQSFMRTLGKRREVTVGWRINVNGPRALRDCQCKFSHYDTFLDNPWSKSPIPTVMNSHVTDFLFCNYLGLLTTAAGREAQVGARILWLVDGELCGQYLMTLT